MKLYILNLHIVFDYEIHGARVLCNPRGYTLAALTPDFKERFVVEICS